MIRVSVVEDDKDLRSLVEEAVNESEELFLSGSYSTAEEFRKSFSSHQEPDVVIMDINLPGINGIQCIGEMKPLSPRVQYLIFTVFEDNVNLFNALCAGATGYLLKSASEEEISRAIIDIHHGGSPMSPQIARMVVNTFPMPKPDKSLQIDLTKREMEILDLLAAGYRYKEIAGKLFLGVETVRSYIRDIYSKLQVHSRTDAVNKIYGR